MTTTNNQSDSINELATALAKAQAEIRNAEEDKSNPHFKSKYATLASIWDACRGPLTKNGLSITQTPVVEDGKFNLITVLMHSSGQWVKSSFPINLTAKIQEVGSQITYIRRYTLSSICGVAPGEILEDDDDGEKAMSRKGDNNNKKKSISAEADIKQPSKDEDFEEYVKKVNELLETIKLCDPDYQKNFNDLLLNKQIASPYDIPESLCKGLMASAKKHIEKKKTTIEEPPF
jgi:hypothetical protein